MRPQGGSSQIREPGVGEFSAGTVNRLLEPRFCDVPQGVGEITRMLQCGRLNQDDGEVWAAMEPPCGAIATLLGRVLGQRPVRRGARLWHGWPQVRKQAHPAGAQSEDRARYCPCPVVVAGVTSKANRKRGKSSPGWSSAKVSCGSR
jgi:hypothetical protein